MKPHSVKAKKMTDADIKKIFGRDTYEADSKYKSMTLTEAKKLLGDRADWELRNMKKALESMRILNSLEDEKRLAAVRVMLKKVKK